MSPASVRTVLFIAFRHLWSRRLLNGIAVGGVTLGVLVLIAMNGIMEGFQQKFILSVLKISPHVTLYDTELREEPPMLARFEGTFVATRVAHATPPDRQARIKRPIEITRALATLPDVEAAAASLGGTAIVEYGGKTKSIELRGIEVAAQERVTPIEPYVLEGKMSGLAASPDGIVVGSGLALELALNLGDIVHASAPGGRSSDLKVVAIYESGIPRIDRARAYTTLRTAQVMLGKPDVVGRIEVRLVDPYGAVEVTERVERTFGYDAESWQEANANFLGIFEMQDKILSFVVGAILLLGGFGILAVQMMIVLQKQRDIAILRSIGLRREEILQVFLVQGVVIAVVGGLVGDGLGKLALKALARLEIHAEGFVKTDTFLIHDNPRMYVYGAVFALVVGVVASLLPAWRGARVEPVDVLRGQIG